MRKQNSLFSLPAVMFKKVLLGMQTQPMPARLGVGSLSPQASCLPVLAGRQATWEPSPQSPAASWPAQQSGKAAEDMGSWDVWAMSALGRQAASDLERLSQAAQQPNTLEDWEPDS